MKNGFDWVAMEKIKSVGMGVSDVNGKREFVFLGKFELVEEKFLLKLDNLESLRMVSDPVIIKSTLT